MGKFHEIDDTIVIDFDIPEGIQELIDLAEEADMAGDTVYFNYADAIDICCKNCCAAGGMTEEQWSLVSRRYKQW